MSVIRIEAVAPTAREMRPLKRGWGSVHWVCILPTHAFLFGLVVFGIVARDTLPGGLFSVVLVASWLVWLVGLQITKRVSAAAQRKSPTGTLPWAWTIDDQAMTFDNGLQVNRVDWRAVKAVAEEKDRFLFLVTPGYNPVLPKRLLSPSQRAALHALIGELTAAGRLGAGLDKPFDEAKQV